MRGSSYNRLRSALIVCTLCVLTILAACFAMLFYPDVLSLLVVATASILASIILLVSIFLWFFRTRKELDFFDVLVKQFEDFGFIRYDTAKRTATVHGEIEKITGVSIQPGLLQQQAYDKLLDDIYRHRHDFEEGVFSSPDGNRWYRLSFHEPDGFICTTVRDLTEYIEKINTINNLRYFDSLTGLFNKQAVTDMLRRRVEPVYKSVGIVHFAVTGIEKIVSFEGAETADDIIVKLSASLKGFENSQSIFVGRTAGSGFTVVLTQGNHEFDDYYEMVEAIHASITATADGLPESVCQYIKVYCGYVIYRGSESDAGKMLAAAEFAAFDAMRKGISAPVRYDSLSYKESASEFNKIRLFNEVISEELIDYHYQPIVSAHTGDIYGYEALMRPHEVDGVKLTALEMVSIAEEQDVLERVESITFSVTLKALSEHQKVFHDKRLFINSVSCVTLPESEYRALVDAYSELFPKLVIEITEANKISEDIIPVINEYFRPYKTHIALDDYGSGYSNDRTLLDIMPNYIKIDRSLIEGIDSDAHKKQLVSNIISYASSYGVYSLAEGVETEAELETVIFLGVDLIQGYITCRPVPIFMHEIADDVKNLIVKYSLMHAKKDDRVFEVKDDTPVDLVNLSAFGYTDIYVKCSTASFYGDTDTTLNMRIICPDDMPVLVKLKDVKLHSDDYTAFEVGLNSIATLRIEGDNSMSTQGIRVPVTSRFILDGTGNLSIDCSFLDGICLGGNGMQSFGRIDLDSTGDINLMTKCDKCVCIGGGVSTEDSVININSGRLTLHARGLDALGIGAHDGEVLIMMNDCSVDADVSGINVVVIGSINGNVDLRSGAELSLLGAGDNCCLIGSAYGESSRIRLNKSPIKLNASGSSLVGAGSLSGSVDFGSSADISVTAAGDNCCLIGTHTGKASIVHIDDGNIKITCNAKKIVGIGSLDGECEITLTTGLFDILCEGNTALCVGNLEGSGDITMSGIVMNAIANSSSRRDIATRDGKLVINGGNIFTNSLDPIEAQSATGSRLICRHIDSDEPSVDFKITDNGTNYRYVARQSPLFDGYYLYLPEDFEL